MAAMGGVKVSFCTDAYVAATLIRVKVTIRNVRVIMPCRIPRNKMRPDVSWRHVNTGGHRERHSGPRRSFTREGNTNIMHFILFMPIFGDKFAGHYIGVVNILSVAEIARVSSASLQIMAAGLPKAYDFALIAYGDGPVPMRSLYDEMSDDNNASMGLRVRFSRHFNRDSCYGEMRDSGSAEVNYII